MPKFPAGFLTDQKGNILTVALATVGMVGLLSYGAYSLLSGPLRSAVTVTKVEKIRTDLAAVAQILAEAATDIDTDPQVEPPDPDTPATHAPAGGGGVPPALFPNAVDPWNQPLGYCAWNHHGDTTGTGARLVGEAVPAGNPVIVVVSSGPDRVFQTSCADAPTYLDGSSAGDDIVFRLNGDGTTSGGPGGGASGGTVEYWERQNPGDEIKYEDDSVLVGNVATPSAADFQVELGSEIDGDLTVAGTTGIGGNATIGNSVVFVNNGDVVAGSVVDAGAVSTEELSGITSTTRVDYLDADFLSNAARDAHYTGAYFLDRSNYTFTVLDPNRLPSFTEDISLTRVDEDEASLSVVRIYNRVIDATAPQDGQVWRWNAGGSVIEPWTPAYSGDVTGPIEDNDVVRIQGRDVLADAPGANQLLGWNGLAWAPMSVGTTGSATVAAFTGLNFLATAPGINSTDCAAGHIPKYVGAAWVCVADGTTGAPILPIDVDPAPSDVIMTAASGVDSVISYYGGGNLHLGVRAGQTINETSPEPDNTVVDRGVFSTFIGAQAGAGCTPSDSGNGNCSRCTVIGAQAAATQSGGMTYSTVLGYRALYSNSSNGSTSIAIGARVAENHNGPSLSDSDSVIIGVEAASNARTWMGTILGYRAAINATDLRNANVVIGTEAGSILGSIERSTILGDRAAYQLSSGHDNVVAGYEAGYGPASVTYEQSVFVGSGAGRSIATGNQPNIALGFEAGRNLTTGKRNLFIGHQAGYSAGNDEDNIYIGKSAGRLKNSSGGPHDVIIGAEAGELGQFHERNVLIGYRAGRRINTGSMHNVILGYQAGENIGAGALRNILIGREAGTDSTASPSSFTGDDNIIIGMRAGRNVPGGPALTTGEKNIVIGAESGGNLTTGSGNILLGRGLDVATSTTNDYLIIGNNRTGVGNVFYGSMITGNMTLKGTLVAASDRRLKRDIRPIKNAMDKIMRLNGVIYRWKKSFKDDGRDYFGLIAQDVEKIVPEVVFLTREGNKEERYSVAYDDLVPLLIEGVKEQDRELESLGRELSALLKKEEKRR